MHSKLPRIEIWFYFFITISFMVKMLYEVYHGSNTFVNYLGGDVEIVPGFSWLNRLQDKSDHEWLSFINFIITFAPLFILHLVIAGFIKTVYPSWLPFWYFFSSTWYLCFYFCPSFCCIVLFQTISVYALYYFNLTLAVWPVGLGFIFIAYGPLFPNIPDSQEHLLNFVVGWNSLKYIDFMSSEKPNKRSWKTFFNYLAYVYYFPTLTFGPFVHYENFIKSLNSNIKGTLSIRLLSLISSLFRFFIWSILTELFLHYFYSNAMKYHLNIYLFDNVWFLNGIGFCMAQFFYVKYLVIYGSLGSILRFEGIEAPPPPRCVNTVHLYSQMWRHFDRGYYLFTVKNIYFPLLGVLGSDLPCKLLASFVSFSFAFLWHGTMYDVLLWTVFNFIVITLEAVGRKVCSYLVDSHLKDVFTPRGLRRLSCMVISPIWLLAVGSNGFFFSGHQYGFMFLTQFFTNGWKLPVILLLYGYCFSQVSEELRLSRTSSKEKPS